MNNYHSIRHLLHHTIAFHRAFVDITDSHSAALMLAQIGYWTDITNNSDGWFYKTRKDWFEETRLSRDQQERARKRLRDLGLVEERLQRMPPKLYFRLMIPRLAELLDQLETKLPTSGDKATKLRLESSQTVASKSPINNEAKSTSKITSKITSKKKQKLSRPVNGTGADATHPLWNWLIETTEHIYTEKNSVPAPWTPRDFLELKRLFERTKKWKQLDYERALANYFLSEDINPADAPLIIFKNLHRYISGILNYQGKLRENPNVKSRSQQIQERNAERLKKVFQEIPADDYQPRARDFVESGDRDEGEA